jgi:hypothetical protein
MNARNEFKRPFDLNLDVRPVLAAARLRLAAWVDVRVARWLERCAANAEAAQRLFKGDRKSPPRSFSLSPFLRGEG